MGISKSELSKLKENLKKVNTKQINLSENQIYLKGHVPSLKNGKRVIGRSLVPSNEVQTYAKQVLPQLVENAKKWESIYHSALSRNTENEEGVAICFQFIRKVSQHFKTGKNKGKFKAKKKQSFDFTGPLETIQDCITGSIYGLKVYKKEKLLEDRKLRYVSAGMRKHPDILKAAWISDDDYLNLVPIIYPTVVWSDEHAGVILTVLSKSEYISLISSINFVDLSHGN
jgi:hypothetical protein